MKLGRFQEIIQNPNNESHLLMLLHRLESSDLASFLTQGIITTDDWSRICNSTGDARSRKARIIYDNLQLASDETIQRFFTTLLNSRNLSPDVLEIVKNFKSVAIANTRMDKLNPRIYNTIADEDFTVRPKHLEYILNIICGSIDALESWQVVKHGFLEIPVDSHEIDRMYKRSDHPRLIIRKTLELWIGRNPSHKTKFKTLVKILNKSNLARVAESLQSNRKELFALTNDKAQMVA